MKILLLTTFTFHLFLGLTQNPANYFNAKIIGDAVALNFELRQGSVCFGIQIERRDAFSNFEQIGVISGVCGSEDQPESYVFTDNQPLLNQRSFYRLIFNGIGQSSELEVFMPGFNKADFVVAIEPSAQQLAIFFRNPLEKPVQLNLFSLSGELIYQAFNQSSYILLPTTIFKEKFFVFHIISEDQNFYVSGKIMLP
jgi:hypothetical protein